MVTRIRPRPRRFALAGVIAVLVLLSACGSDTDSPTSAGSASSTTTTTETTTTGTPSTAAPGAAIDTAVWPDPSGTTRVSDPVDAARTFAVDELGFVDPEAGEFQQGDSRSGEVEIEPAGGGPVTTVFVRQLSDDGSWWVLGAATANIVLESPTALEVVESPVEVAGRSTAFEATVNVEVREDGSTTPLAEDIVMGGANGEMGPFAAAIGFDPPSAAAGAIVLKTISAKDGTTSEASVVRVRFSS